MRQQVVQQHPAAPGQQGVPAQRDTRRQFGAAAAQDEMVDQHHAEQRGEHRADQQQEVLVLGQRRQPGDHRAQQADGQGQVLDLERREDAHRDRRRVDVGEGVLRLVEQDQQQRDAQPGAGQRQQQGIGLGAVGGERQGVGHAEGHQPDVAEEEADRGAGEHPAGTLAEARVVGDQWQPGQRHGDGDVEAQGERQRAVAAGRPQRRQVGLGQQVPGQPETGAEQQPDAPLAQHAAHEGQRPGHRQEGRQRAEEQRPQQRTGPAAAFAEGLAGQQAGGVAHDDDLEGAPADQLQQVEQRRQRRAARAQAELERGHRGQPGVAADHRHRAEQQHADQGAGEDRQQRPAHAQPRRQQRAELQDHQADAEGKPQREQVARAEHAAVEGDGEIGGIQAGCAHDAGSQKRLMKVGWTTLCVSTGAVTGGKRCAVFHGVAIHGVAVHPTS
ncbi:hypothetical protein D9M70_447360 [compost metagenome]